MDSNFLSTANLSFLAIYALIALVLFAVFFAILRVLIKGLSSLFVNIFPRKQKNLKTSGEDIEVVVKEIAQSQAERANAIEPEAVPSQKLGIADYSVSGEKKVPEQKEKTKIDPNTYQKGRPNSPEAGLSALKSQGNSVGTLESKMPSRGPTPTGQDREIKIPRSKKIEEENPLKPAMDTERIKIPVAKDIESKNIESKSADISLYEKPEVLNKSSVPSVAKKEQTINQNKDSSFFEGKKEISRIALRQKLRSAKTYAIEKSVGLTLSPVERAKLEKQVFSPILGYNISKSDLKLSVNKLSRKLLSTKDAKAHEKLRKEIKFFKKLGGIK